MKGLWLSGGRQLERTEALARDEEQVGHSARSVLQLGFGAVLLLIVIQLVFRLAAPDEDWANVLSIVLQASILGTATVAARVPWRVARFVFGFIATVIVLAISTLLMVGQVGAFLLLTGALVVVAPAMIVYGSAHRVRAERVITLDVMFGVLGIYLLLGYAFSLVFQAIGDIGSGDFFADDSAESPANFLYFSFVTMTTVGYGDLAPAEGVGRAFAIALALVGQIYLVTVVAIIVSSLGARASRHQSLR